MPTALADFRASLGIARELLRLESGYQDPPPPADRLAVEGLRGGATVLMVGAFEDFLEAVFQEHLARLDGSPPPVPLSALPETIQATSLFSSLDRALKGPRYTNTTRLQRLPGIRLAAQRIIEDRLDPTAMSEFPSNPNSGSIKALFKGVGLADIFSVLKPKYEAKIGRPVAQTYMANHLDRIVQNRHVVAHTGSALSISRTDLPLWVAFFEDLAELVDDEINVLVTQVLAPSSAASTPGSSLATPSSAAPSGAPVDSQAGRRSRLERFVAAIRGRLQLNL